MVRLEPIEKPSGFKMRMAYWGMKRQMGKVMTPVKVLGPRMPGSLKFTNEIAKFEMKKLRLDPELHYMIAALGSQINGCSWCSDFARSIAIRDNVGLEKINTLGEYRTSKMFTPRERAALAYAEEATRSKHVTDATFAELLRHFKDWEIVEITWINAINNYYNLINIPLEISSDGFCGLAQAKKRSQSS